MEVNEIASRASRTRICGDCWVWEEEERLCPEGVEVREICGVGVDEGAGTR